MANWISREFLRGFRETIRRGTIQYAPQPMHHSHIHVAPLDDDAFRQVRAELHAEEPQLNPEVNFYNDTWNNNEISDITWNPATIEVPEDVVITFTEPLPPPVEVGFPTHGMTIDELLGKIDDVLDE